MYNYLAQKHIKRSSFICIVIITVIFALLITFIRWYAVADTIRSYANMFSTYEPDHALFLWVGQREFLFANRATTLSSIAKFISDFFPLLAIPMLLILFGTDSYYKDRRAGLIQVICTKEKKYKYIISQLVFCFMLTFLIIAAFLLVQLVISMVVNRTIVIHRLPVIDQMPYTVFEYIFATFRIGLYYAALSAVAYAVSLFIKRVYVIILLIPVILSMGSTVIMIRLFYNDPLALAFMDSGLAHPNLKYYWFFVMGMLLITAILTGIRLLLDRTHESID